MKIMKRIVVLLVSIALILLAITSPAFAQMGAGAGIDPGHMRGSMMHADDFGHMDSRFTGFTENTLTQTCGVFGVSIDDAISDLGLPADINRAMTIGDIELQYGVKNDDIANYMVMHMRGTTTSFNARNMVDMRQQATHAIRSQSMVHGLNFMKEGGTSYGHYVTYTFNESGEIKDFTLSGDAIFDSVIVSDFDYSYESLQGAVVHYIGTSSMFLLHDNPTATMQVKAVNNKIVTFNLAEGVEAEMMDDIANDTVFIKITKGNFEGYLITCRDFLAGNPDMSGLDVDITGSTITVELVGNSQVMFRATPMEPQNLQTQYQYSQHMSYMHQMINQGIAIGRVGTELTIRDRGNTTCLLNYTPVNLRVKEAIRNHVVLGVESEWEEGQVITINLDNETIDLTRPEHIRLRYDGIALERAANIDELFEGGNRPLCYLLQENDTVSMAVYIPEFSEHEIIIDVEEPESTEEPTGEEDTAKETTGEQDTAEEEASSTPAFGAALALVTLAGAYIRRRS
ncbi:MAG TPA: hypothetical protein C5S50_06935 [Methanosarcinaceae archaeon]|nr:hypothetical protein [Methanosarcinaceae archaeon]